MDNRKKSIAISLIILAALAASVIGQAENQNPVKSPETTNTKADAKGSSPEKSKNAEPRPTKPTSCIPEAPKPGYVQNQETAGGHLLDRHVGKSDGELHDRLKSNKNLIAASTFTDNALAEKAVIDAAKIAAPLVNSWAIGAKPGRRTNIVVDVGYVVGHVAHRFSTTKTPGQDIASLRTVESRHVRLIIEKRAEGPCLLLTGYPALVLKRGGS